MKLNFGNQIRLNRRRMNLTQEQLAEKFGTSPQAISRWEIGATYPDIEMLPMIASFFETSVDALLGVTEEEKEAYCVELQESFEAAVRAKDVRKTIEIMRRIRRNLKDYQQYWFWGMYHEIWKVRLFQDQNVLEEMRLLAEEVFRVCPKDQHYAVTIGFRRYWNAQTASGCGFTTCAILSLLWHWKTVWTSKRCPP